MKFSQEGINFSKRCRATTQKLLEESLSSIEDLILEGDVETTEFQIRRLEDITPEEGEEHIPYYVRQKGVLHYAVLCRNHAMVKMLLAQGCKQIIDRNDYITGFTPLHFALFVQSPEIMWELIKNGANPYVKDNFDATIFDYARLLGMIPNRIRNCETIAYYDPEQDSLSSWTIAQAEEALKVTWCPHLKIDFHYLFELMYSGFSVENKDMKFREKYGKIIYESSGDENLILAKINEKVGYGAYAAKDFEIGDYIVRYGGYIMKEKNTKSHSYCMSSGVEGVILNSESYRNMGGMINHAKGSHANAEARCVFDRGVEQAIIVATKFIPRGYQIFLDYSDSYFGIGQICTDYMDFSTCDGFPLLIPKIAVVTPEELIEKYGNATEEKESPVENQAEKEIESKTTDGDC